MEPVVPQHMANWSLEPSDKQPGAWRLVGEVMRDGTPTLIRTSPLVGKDGNKAHTKTSIYYLGDMNPDFLKSNQALPILAEIDKLPNPRLDQQKAREVGKVFLVSDAMLMSNGKGGQMMVGVVPGHPLNPNGVSPVQSSSLVAYDLGNKAFVTKSGSRYAPNPENTTQSNMELMGALAISLPKVGELTPLKEEKAVLPMARMNMELANAGQDI